MSSRRVLPTVREAIPATVAALGYCIGVLVERETTKHELVPAWVHNALWGLTNACEREGRDDE